MKVKDLAKKIGGRTSAFIVIVRGSEEVSRTHTRYLKYANDKALATITGMNDTVAFYNIEESSMSCADFDIIIQTTEG